jgi:arylamine N-acetyltransferase
MEKRDLGGTCFSLNPYLGNLLRALGYETELLGADMTRPNVHTCLRVRLDSVPYHVDVGYGGPFREPIRLDWLPFEMVEGVYHYVLDANPRGEGYEMAVFSGEERVQGYVVHDPPRPLEFFADSLRNSFAPNATFLNCLRLCRFFEDHSVTLLDRTLSIHRGAATEQTEFHNLADWESAIATHLRMPRCPARMAIPVLEQITGKPFFEAACAELAGR